MNVTLSNTLYHFTNFDALKAILFSSEFHVKLNTVQWFSPDNKGFYFKIPMVCFCETPLQFLKHHKRNFGNYGLGMKIEWAIAHGIHNVIYADMLNPNSHALTIYELLMHYHSTPAHLKKFRYDSNLNNYLVGSSELMVHRDEREWRFIGKMIDPLEETFTPKSLTFTINDIDQIICPKEDTDNLIQFLKEKGLEKHEEKILKE